MERLVDIIKYYLFVVPLNLPKLLYLKIVDIYRYFKYTEWQKWQMYGLYVWIGMFGAGKTFSMVNKAYDICKRFPQVKLLTNIEISNFPQHTEVIKLTNFHQIIDIEGDTLILLDEISALFNSRNWSKKGIPTDLIGMLLQIRKEKKVIFATAQRWNHTDALLRQITFIVCETSTWLHRWTKIRQFWAEEYEDCLGKTDMRGNKIRPKVIKRELTLQTEFRRHLYDTLEMLNAMKNEEFLTAAEILEKQGKIDVIQIDKKQSPIKKISNNL